MRSAFLLVLSVLLAACASNPPFAPSPTASNQASVAAEVSSVPVESAAGAFSDGRHVVGQDVQPGTYRALST